MGDMVYTRGRWRERRIWMFSGGRRRIAYTCIHYISVNEAHRSSGESTHRRMIEHCIMMMMISWLWLRRRRNCDEWTGLISMLSYGADRDWCLVLVRQSYRIGFGFVSLLVSSRLVCLRVCILCLDNINIVWQFKWQMIDESNSNE